MPNLPQKRVVVYCDGTTHKRLKSLLALEGKTVSEWFRSLAEEKVKRKKNGR